MIRMTVATDGRGNVLGAYQHVEGGKDAGATAGVSFGHGAELHTIEVGADMDIAKATDAAAFHAALERSVRAQAKRAQ